MLIVGGEDHKAGQADDQAGALGPTRRRGLASGSP